MFEIIPLPDVAPPFDFTGVHQDSNDLIVLIGDNKLSGVKFTATGSKVTYQWYCNDEALALQTCSTLSGGSELESGEYYCIASSPYGGSLESDVFTIFTYPAVYDLKPSLFIRDSDKDYYGYSPDFPPSSISPDFVPLIEYGYEPFALVGGCLELGNMDVTTDSIGPFYDDGAIQLKLSFDNGLSIILDWLDFGPGQVKYENDGFDIVFNAYLRLLYLNGESDLLTITPIWSDVTGE